MMRWLWYPLTYYQNQKNTTTKNRSIWGTWMNSRAAISLMLVLIYLNFTCQLNGIFWKYLLLGKSINLCFNLQCLMGFTKIHLIGTESESNNFVLIMFIVNWVLLLLCCMVFSVLVEIANFHCVIVTSITLVNNNL